MGQTCCIYCRISEDREGAGLGVGDQEHDCRELADQLGLEVVAVFSDNDVSAYSSKPRPGYEDMLRLIATGKVSAVLAWHSDRLHRSPLELEHYISATQDIPTHTVKAGKLDLATPHGRLVARQLGALARYESEHKAERVARAYERRVLNGGFGGGPRRFGFEPDGITIRPTEAAEIVKAAGAVLTGQSLSSIVRDWNARGIKTPHGNPWTNMHLVSMLKRPRNAGILVFHGQEAGKAPWEPILAEAQWREVVSILSDPARRTHVTSNRISELGSGLYVCGLCAAKLRVGTSGNGSKVRCYRCPDHNHLTQAQQPLDEFVEWAIIAKLSEPDAISLLTRSAEPDLSGVYTERQVVTGRLEELGAMFAAGDIDGISFKRANADLRAKLAALDARIQASESRSPLSAMAGAEDVAARWAELDLSVRRGILDTLMVVTVGPARYRGGRFDQDRVSITSPDGTPWGAAE
jgi:site-specific DNA recombinase